MIDGGAHEAPHDDDRPASEGADALAAAPAVVRLLAIAVLLGGVALGGRCFAAELLTPRDGDRLSENAVFIRWSTAAATGQVAVGVGTTPGESNIYRSRWFIDGERDILAVSGLPNDGSEVYVSVFEEGAVTDTVAVVTPLDGEAVLTEHQRSTLVILTASVMGSFIGGALLGSRR